MAGKRVRVLLAAAVLGALGSGAVAACSEGGGTDNGDIDGSILAQVTAGGNAVQGAQIAVSPGGATQTTASNGQARFDGLNPGSYTVTLQQLPAGFSMGSETAAKGAAVASGQTASVSWSVQQGGGGNVREIRVTTGFAFNPSNVTVARGTTVRWINDSSDFHTVTSETNAWNEGTLPARNAVFEVTLNTAGTYRYRCVPHSTSFTSGMVGTITVQ